MIGTGQGARQVARVSQCRSRGDGVRHTVRRYQRGRLRCDVGQCVIPQRSVARNAPTRDPETLAAGLISMLETHRPEIEPRARIVENFSVEKVAKLTEESIVALLRAS